MKQKQRRKKTERKRQKKEPKKTKQNDKKENNEKNKRKTEKDKLKRGRPKEAKEKQRETLQNKQEMPFSFGEKQVFFQWETKKIKENKKPKWQKKNKEGLGPNEVALRATSPDL